MPSRFWGATAPLATMPNRGVVGAYLPPSAFNQYSMVQVGDSRTIGCGGFSDARGSAYGGTSYTTNAQNAIGWVEQATNGKAKVHEKTIDYGIGGETTYAIATIPRSAVTKGIDYVAKSSAGTVIVLMGTNDPPTMTNATDPGKGSGALSATNSRSNVRYLIEYLTDPVKNAAVNLSLGIDGGVSNLNGNNPKTIILCNELPRGRYVANGGTTTLGQTAFDGSALYAFSNWLMTLDSANVATTGYANCIVANTYDALADYTTIPTATPGRRTGAAQTSGTVNSDTFLPLIGCFYDGLHPTAYGGRLQGKAIATAMTSYLSGQSDYFGSLFPASGNAASFLTPNPRLAAGTNGFAPAGWASVVGATRPDYVYLNGNSQVTLTISSRTDTDSELVWRFVGSGTTTATGNVQVTFGFYSQSYTYTAPVVGDKFRFITRIRLLSAAKLNGIGISGSWQTADTNAKWLNRFIATPGSNYASRTYLMDTPLGIDPGMGTAAFETISSNLIDTSYMNTDPTQPPWGTLAPALTVNLFANATDAPIGTTVAFDFEMKGLGLIKVTGR